MEAVLDLPALPLILYFVRVRQPGWIERPSFHPLETSSSSLNTGAYVFIGVGAVTMLMGFLGCIGAVNEVRCLLGLVSRPLQHYPPSSPSPALAQAGWGASEMSGTWWGLPS